MTVDAACIFGSDSLAVSRSLRASGQIEVEREVSTIDFPNKPFCERDGACESGSISRSWDSKALTLNLESTSAILQGAG